MRKKPNIFNVLTVVIRRSLVFACLVIFSLFAVYTYTRVNGADQVHAAESTNLNFQARLYNSDGSLVDDGMYNVEFKLFDAVSSSGSSQGSCAGDANCIWTETRTGGNQVRVVNGYFSVNLGSVNAFPSTVAWDQEHWLTLNIGGTGAASWDGEMTPRIKLTAVPYAFKAAQAKRLIDEQLNGTGTLEWLTLTGNRTISLPDASGTVLLDSTGFANGGNTFGGTATLGTNDSNDLILETGGVEGLRIDQNGNVSIGTLADALEALEVNGGIKLGNTTGTNAGTLRWTGTDFEGYNGVEWLSLTATGGGGGSDVVYGTYTFDADGDSDETDWTWVSDNGSNGLNPADTARAWSHDTDDTVSNNVGPTSGQGGSPDGYVYTESSSPAAGGDTFTTTLNSNLDADAYDWNVEFYWNQRGDDNLATVEVQTNENSAGWVTRGTYGTGGPDVATSGTDVWNYESLDLSGVISDSLTEVRFLVTLGSTGNIFNNDFGLDTVTVTGSPQSSGGGGGGGSGSLNIAFIQAVDSAGGTDINNASATALPWGSESNKDTGFTHDTVTNNSQVALDDPGWYKITYNVIGDTQANNRSNIQCQVRFNGSTIVPTSSSYSYTRQAGDPGSSNTASFYYQTSVDDEYYEVLCSQNGSAGAVTSVAGESYTIAEKVVGGSSSGLSFLQNGNAFGVTAILGTTDANGVQIITNNSTALEFSSTGAAEFFNGLTVDSGGFTVDAGGIDITGNSTINGTLDGLTGLTFTSGDINLNGGSIVNIGSNLTATAGLTLASSGAGDLTLDSAGGVIDLNGDIWRRIAVGTTTIQLNDSADTTLSLANIGTGVANLSVDGEVTATGFSGSGSGLTSLNASNISSGTLDDLRLSSNVALLDTAQTFTALQTLNSGLVLGNTASATSGALRWTGSDFEGYDGLSWVSLTGGGGGGSNVTTVRKSANEVQNTGVNPTATLQNDDHLLFPVGTSETWSFRFVVQANANATPDIKFAVTAPAGSTCTVAVTNVEDTVGVSNLGCGVSSGIMNGTSANEIYEITGTVVTGGTAGNVQLQWAQNTASASNVTVYAGSYLNAFPQSEYTLPPSTVYVQGGNTFGGTAILGTGDNFGLNFVTNGANRLSFTNAGAATFANGVTFNSTVGVDGAINLNGGLTIGDNIADGLTIVSGNVALTNGLNFDSNTFVIDSADNQVGIRNSSPGNTFNVNTPTTADSGVEVLIATGGAANTGLAIQGAVSQSANIFEIQDSTGAVLSGFDSGGGLVLGQSTISSLATGLQTINFSDNSGTVCLDSNNCGYVEFASGTQQSDSSNNDVISIDKTSATGNLLTLERSGTGVFTIYNSGAVEIQLDSTNAFSVLNASGSSMFNVDTSAGIINIGSLTADGSGVLFVFDVKNTAGDPTGVEGAEYYNSSLGKFRCYEAGEWKDCIGTRQVRSFIDSTSDAVVDANTTNYWDTAVENNNSYPNITLSATTKSVTGSVVVELASTTTGDRSVQMRVERGIGSVPTCGSGTVVGAKVSTFTTNNGEEATNTVLFLDEPATTSQVFYVLCSDNGTNNAGGMTVNRIRITLEEANNSN